MCVLCRSRTLSTRFQRDAMSRNIRFLIGSGLVAIVLGVVSGAIAQPALPSHLGGNIKFNSGQTVQPIFDGWSRNADGSFAFHFGYLNRNHVEELSIPIGPNNMIEPGGPDRGQPTYFYTRFNKRQFTVNVPANWGKQQELVWTLTTRGKAERAIGWLHPEWEISAAPRGAVTDESNRPPTVSVTAPARLETAGPLTLTASVTDDGIPPIPKTVRRRSSENPPTFRFSDPTGTAPVNVPQVERRPARRVEGRLSLAWSVWRGPAGVSFDPPLASADSGTVTATATFSKPGEYVLRARASDPGAVTVHDVKITVGAP